MKTYTIRFGDAICCMTHGLPLEPVVMHEVSGSPHISDLRILIKHIRTNGPTCPICSTRISPAPTVHRALQDQINRFVRRELGLGNIDYLLTEYRDERTELLQRLQHPRMPPILPTRYFHGACNRNHQTYQVFLNRAQLHREIKDAIWTAEKIRRHVEREEIFKSCFVSCLIGLLITEVTSSSALDLEPSYIAYTIQTLFVLTGFFLSLALTFPRQKPSVLTHFTKEEISRDMDEKFLQMDDRAVPSEVLEHHLRFGGKHLREHFYSWGFFPTSRMTHLLQN